MMGYGMNLRTHRPRHPALANFLFFAVFLHFDVCDIVWQFCLLRGFWLRLQFAAPPSKVGWMHDFSCYAHITVYRCLWYL